MGRIGKLHKDALYWIIESNEYYEDTKHPRTFELDELNEMCNFIGIKYKTLVEYLSKKIPFTNGIELYKAILDKQTNEEELVKLN